MVGTLKAGHPGGPIFFKIYFYCFKLDPFRKEWDKSGDFSVFFRRSPLATERPGLKSILQHWGGQNVVPSPFWDGSKAFIESLSLKYFA